MATVVAHTYKLRRGTAAQWIEKDTLLLAGEPGVELDTNRFKIGDGVTRWGGLDYYLSQDEIFAYVTQQIANATPITPEEVVRIADLVRVELVQPELPDLVLYYENTKA